MHKLVVVAASAVAAIFTATAVHAAPRVDPQMQQVLDAMKALGPKPLHTVAPEEARNQPSAKDAVSAVLEKRGKAAKPESVAKVEDRRIEGPAGPIDVRVYTPSGNGPFPGIVYFHGGGFVVADLDTYDASARALANQAKAVVVSAHYRQAPEHPFPASHDDAQAAFRHVHNNAAAFGIDPARIAVAGESAGANLATVVAMRQLKEGGAMPMFQLLVYPFVSDDLTTTSHQQNGTGAYLVGTEDLAWFWRHELGGKSTKSPEALPIHATQEELRGLPPAFVIVAALDPLLDEGLAYAKNLQAAGVPTQVKKYEGVTHEFFGMAAVVPDAKQAQNDAGKALRDAFAKNRAMGR